MLLRLSCEATGQALVLAVDKTETAKLPVATLRDHFDGQVIPLFPMQVLGAA